MIEIYKFRPDAVTPSRANPQDAGLDLYAVDDCTIPEGHTGIINTGISIRVWPGFCGKIEDRSSLASMGLRVGGGIIDAGFNGQIKVVMHNLNFNLHSGGYHIRKGQKIAQIVLHKVDTTGVMVVTELWNSERGDKGFGSSNK